GRFLQPGNPVNNYTVPDLPMDAFTQNDFQSSSCNFKIHIINNMKVVIVLFALLALGSCGQIRRVLKAPYNQQPVRIEVPKEEEAPVPQIMSNSHAPEEEFSAPVRSSVPVRQKVAAPPTRKELEEEVMREAEEEKKVQEQNKNAKYSFAAAVDDGIMDHSHVREEQRDGSKVTGSYSYSDGYVKRTVKYVADENGYRVISEESEDIGDGPNVDKKNGKADVHT
ncbi:unnamed protein product, partial [Allacma fusca]